MSYLKKKTKKKKINFEQSKKKNYVILLGKIYVDITVLYLKIHSQYMRLSLI